MSEIQELPVIKEVQEQEPEVKKEGKFSHLAMRFVLPFTVEMVKAIEIIKPMATDLADKSNGEYTFSHIWQGLWPGHCHLYMVYTAKSETDANKIEDVETGWFEFKDIDKDFAGYAILKWEFNGATAHVWQAVIEPKYNNTNLLQLGWAKIEDKLKWLAVENITLSSPRQGWHEMSKKLGFEETFTIYRKKLKEDK